MHAVDLTEGMLSFVLLHRLERLEHLAAKFNHKAAIHESWTAGKDEMLAADDLEDVTLAGVLVRIIVFLVEPARLCSHVEMVLPLSE